MKPAEQSILFADARQKTDEFKENLKEGWSTLLLLLLRECADECRRSTQEYHGIASKFDGIPWDGSGYSETPWGFRGIP